MINFRDLIFFFNVFDVLCCDMDVVEELFIFFLDEVEYFVFYCFIDRFLYEYFSKYIENFFLWVEIGKLDLVIGREKEVR